jgi:hypothetical protein
MTKRYSYDPDNETLKSFPSPPPTPNMMKRLHLIARDRLVDDSQIHAYIREQFGKNCLTEITTKEYRQICDVWLKTFPRRHNGQ